MTELSAIGTFTTEDIVTGSCGKVLANTQMKVVFLILSNLESFPLDRCVYQEQ